MINTKKKINNIFEIFTKSFERDEKISKLLNDKAFYVRRLQTVSRDMVGDAETLGVSREYSQVKAQVVIEEAKLLNKLNKQIQKIDNKIKKLEKENFK